MTTTKPPVLTEAEVKALFDKHMVGWHSYFLPLMKDHEQAVLARAGADAVRGQAIEALTLCSDQLLHNGVPTDMAHPRRIALEAADTAIRALKVTPAAAVADSMPGWSHWEARIKALMQDMGMPNSHSAYQALAQLANEMGQAHAATAPQAGQLSGNAGEVDDAEIFRLMLANCSQSNTNYISKGSDAGEFRSMRLDLRPGECSNPKMQEQLRLILVDFAKRCAAIAASKGANHG